MSEVKVAITGDNTGLIAALTEAKAAVAESAEQMKIAMEGVASAFEKVNVIMLAVTAVMAGGAAFKEAIQASAGAAFAAGELGRQLGITATQASVLKVAMDENFVSQEAVTTASNKIAQTLKTNENAFTELGVATRDSNGNFRSSVDIMQDVNTKLADFKDGTDRNVEGMKIYGRGWNTVESTVRLTAAAMTEAKEKAESLGLIVGKEGADQALAYKKSVAGVHTVLEAMEKVIGDALVPALTAMGEWFASVGPQAVAIMRTAVYTVYAAFSYLKEGVTIAKDVLVGQVEIMAAQLMQFARTAERALHLDWKGAQAAWDAGAADIEATSDGMSAKIQADMAAAAASRDKFFEGQDAKQTPTTEGTGTASSGGDGKEHSQLAAFEAALEQRKAAFGAEQAAEGSLREFGKQQEIDYWQSILETTRVSATDKIQILKKIAVDEQAIQRQTVQGALADLKARADEQKDSLAMRLSLEYEYAAKVLQAYGADSKQYAEAQKAIVETRRATVEQLKQADQIRSQTARTVALNEVQVEQDAAKLKYDEGRLSLDQYLALETQFENKKFALKREELEKELALEALGTDSPVRKAQLDQQLEALETTHQAAMFKIQQQAQTQINALYKNVTNSLSSGFASAFQGVIQHTQTMGQAVKGVFTSLLSSIIQFFAQWAAKALVQHVIAMAMNKQEAGSNAAVAATGGAKSAAAIPYVGWLLAIGAAAAIFAAASSYSAAGGFDVPGGMNPMTQLHSKEMVLPAPLAETVRNMTNTGGPAEEEGGGDAHVHFHGTDVGGGFWMAHQDHIVDVVKHAYRRGKLG